MNAANAASNTRGSAYTVEYGWWDTPFSLVLNNARGVTKHAAAWKEGHDGWGGGRCSPPNNDGDATTQRRDMEGGRVNSSKSNP